MLFPKTSLATVHLRMVVSMLVFCDWQVQQQQCVCDLSFQTFSAAVWSSVPCSICVGMCSTGDVPWRIKVHKRKCSAWTHVLCPGVWALHRGPRAGADLSPRMPRQIGSISPTIRGSSRGGVNASAFASLLTTLRSLRCGATLVQACSWPSFSRDVIRTSTLSEHREFLPADYRTVLWKVACQCFLLRFCQFPDALFVTHAQPCIRVCTSPSNAAAVRSSTIAGWIHNGERTGQGLHGDPEALEGCAPMSQP